MAPRNNQTDPKKPIRKNVVNPNTYKPATASNGQKQEESSCPPIKKAVEPVENQGKANVTWNDGDEERKKREEKPKKKTTSSTGTRS
ncbi:hypothetical protein BGAL_0085g00210 [Botrytis galanthina]|uniref:Uncharacterized protein n=1 Tax=Botrytis galanthina TaxID=278940 RepID=A0A4S8R438_9HELO|nr:hypothetical protein BGAL_0085g00210 [Botrytis galanthina]